MQVTRHALAAAIVGAMAAGAAAAQDAPAAVPAPGIETPDAPAQQRGIQLVPAQGRPRPAIVYQGVPRPAYNPGIVSRMTMREIPYSDALNLARSGQITDMLVTESTPPTVYVHVADDEQYVFIAPDLSIMRDLAGFNTRVAFRSGALLPTSLASMGQFLFEGTTALAMAAFVWIQLRPRIMAKTRRFKPSAGRRVTFRDVAGQEDAKKDLMEVVQFLKDPAALSAAGADQIKGVLMRGPPGNGKTLLARAIAHEAGVPFFYLSAPEVMGRFIGQSAETIRNAYRQARKAAPSVLFIDEIDAVAKTRGGSGFGGDGQNEHDQVLTQMLTEMDGVDGAGGVVTIGATNRPETIDAALMRPGRFDRHVDVGLPDRVTRRKLIEVARRKVRLEPSIDVARIERITTGFSCADVMGMFNEAAYIAHRAKKRHISMDHVVQARDKVTIGPVMRGVVLSEKERRTVSYHEAGHAIVALLDEDADEVDRITILPRRGSLGHVLTIANAERYTVSRSKVRSTLRMMMAGRAAELSIMTADEITGAAEGDIAGATRIAAAYVCRQGLDDGFGPVNLAEAMKAFPETYVGSQAADDALARVRALLQDALREAKELIEANSHELRLVAEAVLERETMSGEEVREVLARHRKGKGMPAMSLAAASGPA